MRGHKRASSAQNAKTFWHPRCVLRLMFTRDRWMMPRQLLSSTTPSPVTVPFPFVSHRPCLLRYITEVFTERSNAFSAIVESRVARAAAVAHAVQSPDSASRVTEATATLVEAFDRPIAMAPPAGSITTLDHKYVNV
jgi:hypothetical protein